MAALTSCDRMTNTGNEAQCITQPASSGNGSANLAGLDFSPKSSELTLTWKPLQSWKKCLMYQEHIFLFSLDCFCSCWKGGDLTWLEKDGGSHIVCIIFGKAGSCTWVVTTSADQLSQYLKTLKYLYRRKAAFPPLQFPNCGCHGTGHHIRLRKFPIWTQICSDVFHCHTPSHRAPRPAEVCLPPLARWATCADSKGPCWGPSCSLHWKYLPKLCCLSSVMILKLVCYCIRQPTTIYLHAVF